MSRLVYLDNAATTFPKPPTVLRKTNFCLKKYIGNASRSSHSLSRKTGEAIYETRQKIADLLSFDAPENICFTYNATYALNFAIKGFITEKCHVITSDFEHNSVIRPLEALVKRYGIEYTPINSADNTASELEKALRKDTKGIVISLASNVIGRSISLKTLSDFALSKGLFLIVDASQLIGHEEIKLKETPVSALCAPGHKALFGIQGSGFVLFKDNKRFETIIEGGSGSESISKFMPSYLPEGYEPGTLAAPSIISLGAGIDYIKMIGLDNIKRRLKYLSDMTFERLSTLKKIKLYDYGNGLISFGVPNVSSSKISELLDKDGICVRGGLHCAPSIHNVLGTTNYGLVRISFSYLNEKSDVENLYKSLKSILS